MRRNIRHLEVRQKYSAARRIFNSLLGVSSGDETLHLMFDILHETLHLMFDILLENEIKNHSNPTFDKTPQKDPGNISLQCFTL